MDLFPETSSEVISAPGAALVLHRAVALGLASDALLAELLRDTPWRTGDVVLFGKRYLQPRLFAWYGDPGASYRYSGTTLEPLPWTARLDDLRRRMERLADAPFNSVLLNYYRDQQDAMGLHADDEPELGDRPVIASLSLGEARPFRLRHRHDKAVKALKLPLPSGSVLVMAGDTQVNWKHEIPRQARPCGPRVNLTFRYIHPSR